MSNPLDTCPQCGEQKPDIARRELRTEDGERIGWEYRFGCCGEPLAAWGYPDEWGEDRFEEQGGDA